MLDSWDGKVALVTGAGRGIGRAIALRLADEGVAVAAADIDPVSAYQVAGEVAQRGRPAYGTGCDVPQADQVEAMVAGTVDRLGQIDILVNNAGILLIKPFE